MLVPRLIYVLSQRIQKGILGLPTVDMFCSIYSWGTLANVFLWPMDDVTASTHGTLAGRVETVSTFAGRR